MKRYYYMDILTILATIAVVFLHTSEYAFSNQTGDSHWIIAVILQVTFIWAVPIFFMMSGANLLDYRERYDTVTFFKKRVLRVVAPFLFWSFIWYIMTPVLLHQPENYHISYFIDGIMHGKIQPVFWYFYVILGFYISAPLISKLTNLSNRRLILYLLGINLLFVNLISYYYTLRNQPTTSFQDGIQIGTAGSIGFFVFGWYLKHYLLTKFQQHILYTAAGISWLIMIIGTCYLSYHRQEFQRNVYSIWGIFGLILSLAIFELFKNKLQQWEPSSKTRHILSRISGTSLGVYVIHEFFIYWVDQRWPHANHSLKYMLLLPVCVWLVSTGLVMVMQRIKILKKIV
ncbi:acyltransferase [Leuconostoc mesenteroides]|uniref:acyltransferase n=1 Tax=Leuconostoc mesenteroides TaxID=1245 RepID=UPI000CF99F7F|nr:acyltransferase [Leuconostoc mesenteroides]QHM55599.1 O-acetyltransferase WecH [Leuconostoc mesenteroides]SPE66529.1 Inner membrane protein YiaH [Leuconostoc mesenteroides]